MSITTIKEYCSTKLIYITNGCYSLVKLDTKLKKIIVAVIAVAILAGICLAMTGVNIALVLSSVLAIAIGAFSYCVPKNEGKIPKVENKKPFSLSKDTPVLPKNEQVVKVKDTSSKNNLGLELSNEKGQAAVEIPVSLPKAQKDIKEEEQKKALLSINRNRVRMKDKRLPTKKLKKDKIELT